MIAPPLRWQQAIAELHRAGRPFVLVTILEVRGSAPRDAESKMVVTNEDSYDTIGGGQLEYRAIEIARRLLEKGVNTNTVSEFALGPELKQCCGGHVKVLFECFAEQRMNIELHGAGHVARALVTVLAQIDCRIRWIDERPGAFPERLAPNLKPVETTSAAREAALAPAGSWHLVMTHSHSLDLEICDAVLSRGDARYLGLIGSRSKAARFRKRLRERGFGEAELSCFQCPIGVPGIGGKAPMEIAISVAAELLARRDRQGASDGAFAGLELVKP